MKTVLVVEALSSGHHSVYFEKIASGFFDNGWAVVAAVRDSDVDKPFVKSLLENKGSGRLSVVPIDGFLLDSVGRAGFGQIGQECAMRGVFKAVYKAAQEKFSIDYVFLPYLDYCLYATALLGSPFGNTPWGGVCMRPSFHYQSCGVLAPAPSFSRIKEFLFKRLLGSSSLRAVYSIDPLLVGFASKSWPALSKRIVHVGDPAELIGVKTYESARKELGVEAGKKLVLIYGAIDKRKGIEVLVRALLDESVDKNTVLLVVGKQSKWAKQFFSSGLGANLLARGRCIAVDKFVDKAMEQSIFAACDMVWLGYKDHYTMSGVLILAAIAKKPILATQEGLIGWYVRNYDLGVALPLNDNHAVSAALASMARSEYEVKAKSDLPDHSWMQLINAVAQ